ncbi:HNH endonuclease signature motif containing protein [Clostridioides sp. ES-S-0123-01]|uniref:HNH endonuclease signature motif containing protein n=1 Tax=Clostridioides sp. ES-S-0123-01 TaxID=2770783 RepID=UPI0039BCC967
MEVQETVIFNGEEYKLMGQKKYYLSQSSKNEKRKHAKGLHVAIWEFNNKREVPEGYHIHHKDFNPLNNNIDNLECIPYKQHLSLHAKKNLEDEEFYKATINNLNKAREKATEWHKSEEGRKWHSEHAKQISKNLEKYKCKCKECGDYFESKVQTSQFCSDKCGERWRGKNRRIKYTSKCIICGAEFVGTKYKASSKERQTCSKSCSNRLNHINRKQKSKSL